MDHFSQTYTHAFDHLGCLNLLFACHLEHHSTLNHSMCGSVSVHLSPYNLAIYFALSESVLFALPRLIFCLSCMPLPCHAYGMLLHSTWHFCVSPSLIRCVCVHSPPILLQVPYISPLHNPVCMLSLSTLKTTHMANNAAATVATSPCCTKHLCTCAL